MLTLKSLASAALAAATLSAPLAASATAASAPPPDSSNVRYYAIDLRETNQVGYPRWYQGTLAITIQKGIVTGYFRRLDSAAIVPVQGGTQGANIWFDIGDASRTHFEGAFQNNAIDGGGWIGSNQFTLHATSEARPAS